MCDPVCLSHRREGFQLVPVCLILLEAPLAMGGLEAMGENSWRAAWSPPMSRKGDPAQAEGLGR